MSSRAKAKVQPKLGQPWADDELRAALPLPAVDSNKFSRGVLTVIAGSDRYPGAACLASYAGQRMGAGYTEVVTSARAADLVLAAHPSLVVHDVDSWDVRDMRCSKRELRQAVCIGPGFDADDERAAQLVLRVLKKARCPVLVDGGGLRGLGSKAGMKALSKRRDLGLATVITPHAGEAMRLQGELGLRSETPARLSAVLSMATGAIVVLKGPDTFISVGNRVRPMYEGTPALAKAGTGDVLAGMIGALLAQGVDPAGAAVLGATLHARAGAIAAQERTAISVTAEDVIDFIPAAIRTLAEFDEAGAR